MKEFKHVALNMIDERPFAIKANVKTQWLAIHKTPTIKPTRKRDIRWTITHIRSGKSILNSIRTLAQAKEIQGMLEPLPVWFKHEDEIVKDQQVKEFVLSLRKKYYV